MDVCADTTKKAKARVRLAAFNMLARREHSKKELSDKLERRFENAGLVQEVLKALQEEGLQSDERFAESFVHSRVQRNQGPVKISYELRGKGVSDELVSSAMDAYQDDWMALAKELVEKKYGCSHPENLKEKQRRMRFVMQRGFPSEICYKLFD